MTGVGFEPGTFRLRRFIGDLPPISGAIQSLQWLDEMPDVEVCNNFVARGNFPVVRFSYVLLL